MNRRTLLIDVALLGSLLALAFLSPLQDDPSRAAWVAAILGTTGVLALRRRAPLLVTLAVLGIWGAVHTRRTEDDPPFQFIAMLVAAYALGAHETRTRGLAGLAALSVVFTGINLARGLDTADTLAGPVQFVAVFGFGAFLSRSRERATALETKAAELEADIDARARAAVADERARIARDMHDALGHAMSVMTLQVGAVRTGLEPHQTAERDTLLAAERAGRDSVAELRRMLGILREGDDGLAPPPSLARLGDLAATIRSAGIDVQLDVGDIELLPPGVDAAAYRIVQEALTNVVRHAPHASARVSVQRTAGELSIEVTDDGAGAKPGPLGAPGHGTVGMRERVGMYGGTLTSGHRPGGGWTAVARLPLSDSEGA